MIHKLSKTLCLLIVLTLVGGFLRLYNLHGTLMFLGDQGRDVSIVRNLLVNFDPILVGPTTSVGKIQLGPAYYYFMAPWLFLFNFNPIGPAIGVALLGTLTIPLLYFVTKKMLGNSAGLIAATLYTFAQVVIENTRFSWNPNPMPFVILLLIWSLYEVYSEKKYKFLILSWVSFAIALQLHYMVILAGPFMGLIWAISFYQSFKGDKKILFLKNWFVGLACFLAFLIPLVIFDFRHDFLNTKGFLEFFQKGHHTSFDFLRALKSTEGRLYQSVGFVLGFEPNYDLRSVVSWAIALSFFALTYIKKNKAMQLISLYLILGVIGLSFYSTDVFAHYLGFIFPISFMMVGGLLGFLWDKKNIWLKSLTFISICLIVWFNVIQYRMYISSGWLINNIENLSQTIVNDSQGQVFNITQLDDSKDYQARSYRYFAEKLRGNILDIDNYQDSKILYVISDKEISSVKDINIWEIQSFGRYQITNSWKFEGGPWLYRVE